MSIDFPLTPHARHSGRGWVDHCPAHDDHTPSLSIAQSDDGRLLLHCFAGCSYEAIIAAAGRKDVPAARTMTAAMRLANRHNADVARQKRVSRAHKIWSEGRPLPGTLSQTYLAGRGLTWHSDAQRHHPALFHAPSRTRLPALVSCIERGNRLVGVHRTFLDERGTKIDRMMLGDCRGGAVRLSEGTGTVVVAEGIETTMSLMQLGLTVPEAGYWAALSATNMARLTLPDRPGNLVVATDGDPVGRNAGNLLATRAVSQRWVVSFLPAPEGRDWNDVLLMNGPQA